MRRGYGSICLSEPVGIKEKYSFTVESDGVHVKDVDDSLYIPIGRTYIITVHFTLRLRERNLREPLLVSVFHMDADLSTIVCLTNDNPLCNFGWTSITTLYGVLGDLSFHVNKSIKHSNRLEKNVILQSVDISIRSLNSM